MEGILEESPRGGDHLGRRDVECIHPEGQGEQEMEKILLERKKEDLVIACTHNQTD